MSRWNRDYGRSFARILCGVFALVGALPLLGGYLVRSRPVLDWAASETARVLNEQLGVEASYRVEMQLWPLELSLHDVVIPSNDGGAPALQATRMAVTPHIFSLLAGRLDVGDIEIDEPASRLVIRDGDLVNVTYQLPERTGPTPELERAPFASVAISDGTIDLDVDGMMVDVTAVDVDVFAEPGPSFEIALRTGPSKLTRKREVEVELPLPKGAPEDADPPKARKTAYDEDALCRLDVRVRVEPQSVLVRRLSTLGSADDDPRRGTRPTCRLEDDDVRRVALRLSQVRVVPHADADPTGHGHVFARAPASLLNRFVDTLPIKGWVGITADASYDGTDKMPDLRGRLRGDGLAFGRYHLADRVDAKVRISDDKIEIPRFQWDFAMGTNVATNGVVAPFADPPTLAVENIVGLGMKFEGFMRDLGVTPNTIVSWDLTRLTVNNFHGKLHPLELDGYMVVDSKDFEIFDRAYHSPGRQHMLGIKEAKLRGAIAVRPDAFKFLENRADFGNSNLTTTVSLGFDEDLVISVAKGGSVDLRDISPLVNIPWAGTARLEVFGAGKFADPVLKGKIAIDDFVFGGFPIGDVLSGDLRFRPLELDMSDVRGRKNKTEFVVKTGRLTFDEDATVIADANIESDDMGIRDFFEMWRFDEDPRFDPLKGHGKVDARVHYVLGGKEDVCGEGYLRVDGTMAMVELDLFEELYDSGEARFDFRWIDFLAGHRGIELDVPSATLKKGDGVILTSFKVDRGATVRGHAIATSVPISKIQALGPVGKLASARTSAVAEIYGTIDDLATDMHVHVSPTRVGNATLPASEFAINLRPAKRKLPSVGTSKCGQPISPPFDKQKFDDDDSDGTFHAAGSLFAGQIRFDDLQVTRQRDKHVSGKVVFEEFDLGSAAELIPALKGSESKVEGKLSAALDIEDLPLEAASTSKAKVTLKKLEALQGGFRLRVLEGAKPIVLDDGRLDLPKLALLATTPGGQKGTLDLNGSIDRIGADAEVNASLVLRPTDLSAFAGLIPRAERARGVIRGRVDVTGPLAELRYDGGIDLENGQLSVRGLPVSLTDINIGLLVNANEIRINKGTAAVGGGTVRIGGSVPLGKTGLGDGRASIVVRGVSLPIADGVRTKLDADLEATLPLAEGDTERALMPRVSGNVLVRSFEYTRPVTMTADISSLAKRGRRTEFEAYDSEDDFIEFDITMRSARDMRVRNNLVDARLVIDPSGLSFAGTNQRFGMRGQLELKPGGRIKFRQNEFEIREGNVRFDDPTRIAPLVDVTAVTEYRRYSAGLDSSGADSSASNAAAGGRWDVSMHAYGDADNLQIDLTSNPELGEDDIFLLLTVGLTRAELDQAQQAAVGGSVALEALGTLTGADQAVSEAVPVIDDFSFGSAYSSRSGRTEPTVTIGKRLAERIRAQVTSGLTESRQVGSNIEWRLSPHVSVAGSYDNQNDISSSALGNLGADIRWRLEFD